MSIKELILRLFIISVCINIIFPRSSYGRMMSIQAFEDDFLIIQNDEKNLDTAIAEYKRIFQVTSMLLARKELILKNCETEVYNKTLFCSKSCELNDLEELKNKILLCMREFIQIGPEINEVQMSIHALQKNLSSNSFMNLPTFAKKLINKLDVFTENNKKVLSFYENLANKYSQHHSSILNSQFAQALSSGALSGKIMGTCLHLKNALKIEEARFKMRNQMKLSYLFWIQFLNKLKGYELLSNALREACPAQYKPANYSLLIPEVLTYVKSVFPKDFKQSECSKPQIKNYLESQCDLDSQNEQELVVGPYLFSILSQVK